MMIYLLYRVGYFLAHRLPLKLSYMLACLIADFYCHFSIKDKNAVIGNLKVVTEGLIPNQELNKMAREVFRNFAKYLVDFFRLSKVDKDSIKRRVEIEGIDNVDRALAKRKGVIILSAHIGNWELGGVALAAVGYNISAVVLTHQNKRINDFFTRQRLVGNMKPIEIGIGLRTCYRILKNNNLLALLGDRDFSKNGIYANFFGKRTLVPKGPALFSYRLGSIVVPALMIRNPDNTHRLIIEEPIDPEEVIKDSSKDEEASVNALTAAYAAKIESFVKRYPTQWYVFRELWDGDDKKFLRPDTIV